MKSRLRRSARHAASFEIDLANRPWQLQGWRPFYWELRRSSETRSVFQPEFGPYPAQVPGSVLTSLLRAGAVKDWRQGRQSLDCEWVEHRQWEFSTQIKAGEFPAGTPVILQADGLDYSGWIRVDDETVAPFRGALVRHRIDLSRVLGDGKAHRLSIMFDLPPEEQGQIGRSSLSRFFKPRFSFSWDWCVRLVPIGIWDRLTLVCGENPVEVISVRTATSANLAEAKVIARIQNSGPRELALNLVLKDADKKVAARLETVVAPGEHVVTLPVTSPRLWWPNWMGETYLYDFTVEDASRQGGGPRLFEARVGFKHVRWLPCQDAPADARPLLCEVNGRKVFLQGVNWIPLQLDYPAIADAEYARVVSLYRRMGCNMLRVWGGGYLEKEVFYRACDEQGLLVWQEFPLSSSGVDNDAPRGPAAIADLETIATDYIRRRGHHASLFLWCGGNELQDAPQMKDGPTRPQDETHPALAALQRVVEREQPEIRFLPTSPSGPIFYAERARMGRGLHHHVHGPWDIHSSEAKWADYWKHDDSLLRSETGVASAASVATLQKYAGDENVWPPSFANPWWRHGSAWFVQWDLLKRQVLKAPPSRRLALYVELSQERQARFLALAARSCKQRFPRCAGFIVWAGHDAFPTPSNLSLIDYDRRPKAAYHALREVFLSK
jgi:beta-mannosidase